MNRARDTVGVGVARMIPWVPVGVAMLWHAVTLQRWALIVPALVVMAYGLVVADAGTPHRDDASSRRWYAVILTGLVAGLILPAAEVDSGPFPASAVAALTAIAVAVSVRAVFTTQATVGWVAAWALVAMSGNLKMTPVLWSILAAFIASSFFAAAVQAGLMKHRGRRLVIWGTLTAAIMVSTWGLATLIHRIDELVIGTVERLMADSSDAATTGIGDSITLGSKSIINPSQRPLLDLSTASGPLRVKVLDQFSDDRWTTSAAMKTWSGDLKHAGRGGAASRSIELLFLEDLDNAIPSPAGTHDVRDASPTVNGGWILRGRPDHVAVTISADRAQRLPPESIQGLELSAVPDELRDTLGPLAVAITGDTTIAATNRDRAAAIEAFFHDHFEYALTTDLTGDSHPLVTLIRERRPAYCTYFASAMALMLRCQGVPTRVVTGFVPGDPNAWTGRVTVRASDAHAWVEVWSPEDRSFIAFDPTPGSSRRSVLGHDDSPDVVWAALAAVRSSLRRLWMLLRYQPAAGLRSLLVSPLLWTLVGVTVWWWKRRRGPSRASSQRSKGIDVDPRLIAHYERYQSALRAAGVTALPHQTDDELLERLKATGQQSLWESACRFVTHYHAARFGNEPFDESQAAL